jgi:hypothetical protein
MERIETMPVKPLITTITGLALLVPASYFSLTLLVRLLFGSSLRYYAIAPAFQQHAFEPSFHMSQLILYGPLLAILINVMTVWQVRIRPRGKDWEIGFCYRSFWLNTAIALQGFLLFFFMLMYLLVQHFRY